MLNTMRVYKNGLLKVTSFGSPVNIHGVKNCKKNKRGEGDMMTSAISSMKRAKNNFLDYVINNDFTHWGMITYDNEKCNIDRYDLEQVQKLTTKRLNNLKQRYDKSLQYLLIFEPHKNGGWHAHMFLYTEKEDSMVKARHFKTKRLIKDKKNRQVYNWSKWAENVGWATFVDIRHTNNDVEQKLKLSQYVTKYVTKNIVLGMYSFNKKKYWHSLGLTLPKKIDDVPEEALQQYNEVYKKDFLITNEITKEPLQNITVTFYNMEMQYSS